MKYGIYSGITNEEYHAFPAISNSYLSRLDKCPAAAKVPQEQTAAMAFGSAAHCYILEGAEVFADQFAVAPVCDKRTKEGKALLAEFQASNEGKTVISVADANHIIAMSKAVHAHPFASKLLASGKAEQSVFWADPATGLQMKVRLDWLPNCGVVADLKTTTDSEERAFTRSILNFGYHRQAALYLDGINAVCDGGYDAFIFIAVEKEAPYRVEVYTLGDDFVDAGREDYRRILDIEIKCRANGDYPHFTNPEITEIARPSWL